MARAADGTTEIAPADRWPAAVRVAGAVVEAGVVYALLESVGALDQPAGLRAAWTEALDRPSPFDASPMALSDVRDVDDLAARVKQPPAASSSERSAAALLATMRAASASTAMLAKSIASGGVDLSIAWQSMFAQKVGRLDVQSAASSPQADRVLAIVRDAVATHACGADACEAWGEHGHAVVRFAVEGGRWVVRAVIEDAPAARATTTAGAPREVEAASDTHATEVLLRERAAGVKRVLAEAPLGGGGAGTIGVGEIGGGAAIAVREGDAVARVFAVDAPAAGDVSWDAAFADVDGDGRTDVVLRTIAQPADAPQVAYTRVLLAPPPSVQAATLDADVASALAVMDAGDARGAAHAAATLPARGVAREDACRLLASASTIAGFRRSASAGARVLLFSEPRAPTWRPKVVPLSRIAPDDVRGIGAHCAEMICSATRPYCAWSAGADSEHAWFDWRDGRLELVGSALYRGE